VILTWILARQVYPGPPALPVLATAFVAFNPMVLFINASVNNDNLVMMLSTAALVVMLPFMQRSVPRYGWRALGLGLLLGGAALTKLSGLALWPLAALAVGWGCWQVRDGRRFVVSGVIILGVVGLMSGWWFWRNEVLYGDWTGMVRMVSVAGPRLIPISWPELIRTEWRGFLISYWAVFGVFSILPGEWVITLFDVLTAGAILGGVWRLVTAWRARQLTPRWAELGVLGLFCIVTLVSLLRWTMMTLASQGRLMFGAIAPLSIFMAAGWLAFVPSTWARRLGAGLALVLAARVFGAKLDAATLDHPLTQVEAKSNRDTANTLQAAGVVSLCVGAAALLSAGGLSLFGGSAPVQPTVFLAPGMGGLVLSGVFP
jgi:hypothetical protein